MDLGRAMGRVSQCSGDDHASGSQLSVAKQREYALSAEAKMPVIWAGMVTRCRVLALLRFQKRTRRTVPAVSARSPRGDATPVTLPLCWRR